jgi:N-acetyl-anhydromuramyl-L-alanine amidase AmpD
VKLKIKQYKSPNFGERFGSAPMMIVLHTSEGSFQGGIDWLCKKEAEASTHFFVSKKGEIAQLVDLKAAAWGNGTTSVDPASNKYYRKAKNPLVRQMIVNANRYSVSIENEGVYKKDGGKLTEAQFKANVELIRHIRAEVKRIWRVDIPINEVHITTHSQITPETKPFCGLGVDLPALVSAVALACK